MQRVMAFHQANIHGDSDPVAAEAARGVSEIEAFLADVSAEDRTEDFAPEAVLSVA